MEKGIINIYHELKAKGVPVTTVALYALFGAVNNIHWTAIPPDVKERLKAEAEN